MADKLRKWQHSATRKMNHGNWFRMATLCLLFLLAALSASSCLSSGRNPYREQVAKLESQYPAADESLIFDKAWYFDGGSHCPNGEGLSLLVRTPQDLPGTIGGYALRLDASWRKSEVGGDVAWHRTTGGLIERIILVNDREEMKLRFPNAMSTLSAQNDISPTLYILRYTAAPVCGSE